MASYLEQIKAANPEAYAQIAKLSQYSANEAFGGVPQDFQAQIFTPLSADTVKQANVEFKTTPVVERYVGIDENGQPAYQRTGGQVIPPKDVQPSYDFSSGSENYGQLSGYTKDLGVVNGIPVTANYDAQGRLTGYQGDQNTRSFLDGSRSVAGSWDASGKPAPKQYSSSSGGFLGGLAGDLAGSFGGYGPLLANLVLPGSGTAISLANTALNGGDLSGALKNLAISQAIGQSGIGGSVAEATGSQALGQLAGNTGAGLLSGNDLSASLSSAALNIGANQAASGLLSNSQSTPEPYIPPTTDYAPADYGYSSGASGLGLEASPAPFDSSNPYSLAADTSSSGGSGFQASLAFYNPSNPYSLQTNYGNMDAMGGGTGIQVPTGSNATLGSIGAEAQANPAENSSANPAATGLLASLIKSALTGSQGTGNMATTTANNNNLLGSLLGGLTSGVGGLMQGSTSAAASQAQADALRQAGTLAQQQSQFRPVGTTTNFGTSSFQIDPTTGQLTGAGYQLSPQLQGMQNTLMGNNTQSLNDAAQLQALGRSYIGQDPNAVASNWYNQQQALLAPSRDTESARLANQLQQTGRTGVSVAQGGNLGAANPEYQALANARAQQDAQMAANAQQYGQQQVNFGQGLLSNAYQPFNAGLSASSNVEALGQQPLTLSSGLAQQSSASGARSGALGLQANQAASQAALNAGQYNPYASALGGLGGSSLFGNALGNAVGNTALGSSLGNWLGSLSGNNLNTAASDWMANNQDITPTSTFNGGGTSTLDPELAALLGL